MAKISIKNRYGTIPNDLLNSDQISFKAKGLYGYIQCKPDLWDFSAERISRQVKEGLPSITSALKELEQFGYLHRQRFQNKKGHWEVEYNLFENPTLENPTLDFLYAGNPMQENPILGKPSNISNKDFSNKEYNNKERVVIKTQTFSEMCIDFAFNLEDEYDNFISYWTEKNNKGKERWQCEKFFDINRRIKNWMSNKSKFQNNGNQPEKLGTSAARMEALKNW